MKLKPTLLSGLILAIGLLGSSKLMAYEESMYVDPTYADQNIWVVYYGNTDWSSSSYGGGYYLQANIYFDPALATVDENGVTHNEGTTTAGAVHRADGYQETYTADADGACHQTNTDPSGNVIYDGACG